MLAQVLVLDRRQEEPADEQGEAEDEQQVRDDAPDALGVEGRVAERVVREPPEDDAGDQVAGNDEEDVDAEKAAVKGFRKGVINENRQDGEGSQAGDVVTPEGRRWGGRD